MDNKYTILNKFIVRRPMFSFNQVIIGLSSKHEFNKIVSNPLFKEAILYASPTLYCELKKYLSNRLHDKDSLRMEKTLIKFLIRMGFRSTPFGLFSLCGIGNFGKKTSIANSNSFIIERDIDFELKNRILYNNLNKLCFDFNICFVTNQTVRININKLLFKGKNKKGNITQCVLYPSEIIKKIIDFFTSPASFVDGYVQLCTEYDISKEEYYQLIYNLVSNLILIPEYISDLNSEGHGTTVKSINQYNVIDSYFRKNKNLFDVKDNLSEFEMDNTLDLLNKIHSKHKEISINNLIKVNSYLTERTIIYEGIKNSIYECFRLFYSITPKKFTNLDTFIRKFKERYETESIPLLVALDPDEGIGYGNDVSGGEHSLLHELNAIGPTSKQSYNINITLSPYEQIISKKMNSHSSEKINVISLSDKDFPQLRQEISISYPSMSCMYKYVGKHKGVDIISDVQFAGPSACKMISRFASEYSEFNELCKDICSLEQEHNEDVLLCEISHLPKDHVGNILSRPCWRDAVCYYMTYPKHSSKNIIEVKLNDLYLKINGSKLIIWSKSLDKQIIPRITSAYNHYYQSSTLYQFLGDMQNGGINDNMTLNITNLLQINNYLPRVQYKNIILSKKSWLIKNELLVKTLRFPTKST